MKILQYHISSLSQDEIALWESKIGAFWSQPNYVPVWQTLRWSRMLISVGQAAEGYLVAQIDDNESITAYAILEKRSIGLGTFGLFCIGGPNFLEHSKSKSTEQQNKTDIITQENEHIQSFYASITTLAREIGVEFVQVEPAQELDSMGWKSGYFKGFLENSTLCIDLSATEEEILAQMKQKGRYNIRLAEKHDVQVTRSTGAANDLDAFMKLLGETLERDGFSGNSRAYYEALLKMCTHKEGGLYLAEKDGEVIAAAIMVIEQNTAVYYYGASTSDNEKRKFMPAYLLQWRMMQAAKSAGCTVYDFLGIAPVGASASHRLAGVTDFKMKFGGVVKTFPERKMVVLHGLSYFFIRVLRLVKSWVS